MENKGKYKLDPVFQYAGQVIAWTTSFSGIIWVQQISVEGEEVLSHKEGYILP